MGRTTGNILTENTAPEWPMYRMYERVWKNDINGMSIIQVVAEASQGGRTFQVVERSRTTEFESIDSADRKDNEARRRAFLRLQYRLDSEAGEERPQATGQDLSARKELIEQAKNLLGPDATASEVIQAARFMSGE